MPTAEREKNGHVAPALIKIRRKVGFETVRYFCLLFAVEITLFFWLSNSKQHKLPYLGRGIENVRSVYVGSVTILTSFMCMIIVFFRDSFTIKSKKKKSYKF